MIKAVLDVLLRMRISSDLRTVAFHQARHPLAVYLAVLSGSTNATEELDKVQTVYQRFYLDTTRGNNGEEWRGVLHNRHTLPGLHALIRTNPEVQGDESSVGSDAAL